MELIVPFWDASLNWLVFAYISCVNHCHMLCGDSFLPDICPCAVDSCSFIFLSDSIFHFLRLYCVPTYSGQSERDSRDDADLIQN